MDLLGYSETVLHICLHSKSRREIHDILRQIFAVPQKIRICPCGTDEWTRKTLAFLGAVYDNEPSDQCTRHGANRELTSGEKESVSQGNKYGF